MLIPWLQYADQQPADHVNDHDENTGDGRRRVQIYLPRPSSRRSRLPE